jgi:hypothetical protein
MKGFQCIFYIEEIILYKMCRNAYNLDSHSKFICLGEIVHLLVVSEKV